MQTISASSTSNIITQHSIENYSTAHLSFIGLKIFAHARIANSSWTWEVSSLTVAFVWTVFVCTYRKPGFFTIMETISGFIDVCIHHRKQIIMLHKLSVPQNFYSNFSCETHTYQCKDYSLFLNQRNCQHDSCTRMNHYCLYRLKIQSYHNHENLHCIHLHLYLLPWKHNHLGREKQPKLHLFF